MNIEQVTTNMIIEGTTEYNILNIPSRAREYFITIIQESHPPSSLKFWKKQWKLRDEYAKTVTGVERNTFLSKCCYDQEEVEFWEMIWKNIDRKKFAKVLENAMLKTLANQNQDS